MNNLKLVRGNDVFLKVPVKYVFYSLQNGKSVREEKNVHLDDCFLLAVSIVNDNEEWLPVSFDVNGSELILKIASGLECGWYGIEVKFRKGGTQYRSYERKVFKIVESNGQSMVSGETYQGEQSYQVDTMYALYSNGDVQPDEGESTPVEGASSPSTTVFVPEGKKIMVCGASFAGENNGWTQLVEHLTGISVVNQAAGGSTIMGNMAARMMYRSFTLDGAEKTLPHGLLFSDIGADKMDTFGDFGCVIIDHVHNKDVFTIQDRTTGNPSEWSAEDYESYFKVADGNGNAAATQFSSTASGESNSSRLSIDGRGLAPAAGWMPIPRNTSDTEPMTYAEAFDYVIKRIKSWCDATETTSDIKVPVYPKNQVQILICSHWTPGRSNYNATSRLLALKHGVGYCEMDKKLGFVKGDDAGEYNRSVLHSQYADNNGTTGRIDGAMANEGEQNYWGMHPICMSETIDYGYGKVTVKEYGATKEVYMPWIQWAMAHAVVDCLEYNPVKVVEY